MNISLFGVEIFIEGSSDDTIVIDVDSELRGDSGNVRSVFAVSTFMGEDQKISSGLDILDKTVDFIRGEWGFGRGYDEEIGLFDFLEFD